MNQPLISIIMNCYNSDRFLKEAIDSVYVQSYINWEIIFWDNASTDCSATIAQSYDDRLKYFLAPKTMPLGEARNMALSRATGKYITFLDCDDLYYPDKLRKQIEVLEKNNDIGLVYSNTLYFSEKQSKKKYSHVMPSGNIFEELLAGYFMSFETVMIRRSVIEERSISFNMKYKVSTDAELFVRIAYYTKCFYIDEVLAKWRYGHGSESDRNLCLFPKEYEMLLEDLKLVVVDFNEKYNDSILHLRIVINNMYGCCEWNKGNNKKARSYFYKALKSNYKYIAPYLLTFIFSYKIYLFIKNMVK